MTDSRPALPPRRALALATMVFVGSAALYLASRQEHTFSDGINLARMAAASPGPYYNLFYLPLAWLASRVGGALGASGVHSLAVLSALSAAAGLGLLCTYALRRGAPARLALPWFGLCALTPGLWFFASTAEVHALQFGCCCLAWILVLEARRSTPRRALVLFALATPITVGAHVTGALLVPFMALAAWGGAGQRGLSARPLIAAAGAAILAIGAVELALRTWSEAFHTLTPMAVLWQHGFDFAVGGIFERGLFSPAEMAAAFGREFLAPLGALLAVPLVVLATGGPRARLAVCALTALIPYAAVMCQSGIREQGAYFLSAYPLFMLLGLEWLVARGAALRRRAPLAVALLFAAVALQVTLTRRAVAGNREEPEASRWAAAIDALDLPLGFVLTTSLPRDHALAEVGERHEHTALGRAYEVVPRAQHEALTEILLVDRIGSYLLRGRPVYVDRDILVGAGRPAFLELFERKLAAQPVELAPLPDAAGPLLFEIVVPGR